MAMSKKPYQLIALIAVFLSIVVIFFIRVQANLQTSKSFVDSDLRVCSQLKAKDLTLEKFIDSRGNELHSKLIQGLNEWVFHPQDFRAFAMTEQEKLYLSRFNSELLSKGVQLVVLKLPQRGQLYFDQLSDEYSDTTYSVALANESYTKFIQNLNDVGILAPNLLEKYSQNSPIQLFYKDDGHWTNEAQALAAQAMFDVVEETNAYLQIPKEVFDISYRPAKDFVGQYAAWLRDECNYEVPIHKVKKVVSSAVSTESLKSPNTLESKLFTETYEESVLVGTSQSLPHSRLWDFSSHLEKELSVPISNESIGGAGGLSMLDFFINSPNWSPNSLKLLIWEHDDTSSFSVNHLRQIIPASKEFCDSKTDIELTNIENNLTNLSEGLNLDIVSGDYLKIEGNAATKEVIQLKLMYENGVWENVLLGHRKVQSNGEYYLELLTMHGALKSVSVKTFNPSFLTELKWQFCRL